MKAVLLVSASVLALCASGALAAPTHVLAAPASVTLYDQNNDDAGEGIVSSNLTSGSSSVYTSYGADDFVIPSGHKWRIKEVDVTGVYTNGETATSENVLFYKNNHSLPGTLVAECDNISGSDNQGSFAIKIPKTCKVSLKSGKTYWLSVVANISFPCCGVWFWETRTVQNGNAAAWENPENGDGTGCTSWAEMTSCLPDGEGPDFMFTLKGRDTVIGTPAPAN